MIFVDKTYPDGKEITYYSTHAYTYDNSGNVTQKVENIEGISRTTQYTYDTLNRLTSENISGSGTNVYTYDEYNNLSKEGGINDISYYYDANNRLKEIVDKTSEKITASGKKKSLWESFLSYDKNGNLLTYNTDSYLNSADESSHNTYEYDAWGRLTNFSDSLGETANYSYYSDGLRASKTIGNDTTKYYYNGDNVINETLNGNSYATNVLGVNGYISRRQNGTTGYLFKNAHGDVLSAYSSTTNKLADYTYDAWGELLTTGTQTWGTSNPIRYNGQYYDTESGMTYLRARYYDSGVRRFITEDPIKDGVNWYAYAGNNPVMFVDPSGNKVYIPENQTEILENLHYLSRDTYGIDSNGYLYIKNYNQDGSIKGVGTELIYQLINNDNVCTIKVTGENTSTVSDLLLACTDNVGCDTNVTINTDYNKQKKVGVYDSNKEVIQERIPVYISLGHELIHALRAMKGHRKNNERGTNVMRNSNGLNWYQEEFDTVGIDYRRDENGQIADASNWYFTENSLRREHGLKMRVNYG